MTGADEINSLALPLYHAGQEWNNARWQVISQLQADTMSLLSKIIDPELMNDDAFEAEMNECLGKNEEYYEEEA